VARVLIVGCGCRGQGLARAVRAGGHSVRATSRTEERRAEIESTGAEFHLGDPDRIGTLTHALDNATILCWLMGSATGDPERVAALHGTRLKMLLERTIDTTVRGMVYEAAGTVGDDILAEGAATVREACDFSEIPHRELAADPADHAAWQREALAAIGELLER
jgi:threonine dehydrogenase-like Zn-dependent dehydrogenase